MHHERIVVSSATAQSSLGAVEWDALVMARCSQAR